MFEHNTSLFTTSGKVARFVYKYIYIYIYIYPTCNTTHFGRFCKPSNDL